MEVSRSNIITILVIAGVVYVFYLTYIITGIIKARQKRDADLIKAILSIKSTQLSNIVPRKYSADIQKLAVGNSISETTVADNKISTNYQTDFFIKSQAHAENVLNTKVILDKYKYGNFMDLTKLDNQTKAAIDIAIKYMSIEPVRARALEQQYRAISEQEKVPLWFVILHEAIKKVVSYDKNQMSEDQNLTQAIPTENTASTNSTSSYEPKVIPIGKVA